MYNLEPYEQDTQSQGSEIYYFRRNSDLVAYFGHSCEL